MAATDLADVKAESKYEKIPWTVPDFVAEHGPALHTLPIQEERFIGEKDCFITEYASPQARGFQAIIKHRYSDFNVFEISADNSVVHLRSLDIPKEQKKPVCAAELPEVKYGDLDPEDRALFSALTWTRIVHMAKKYLGNEKHSEAEVVNIDVTGKDKVQKKRIHDLVRKYFPHLCSHTGEKEDPDGGTKKSLLCICFKSAKSSFDPERWPSDRPKFLRFTLYKEDTDQILALSQIGRNLQGMRDKFGFAGTKDKRARTSQKITVPHTTPHKLLEAFRNTYKLQHKVALGDFEYVKDELALGKSNGNRFSIVLRNVTEPNEVVDAALRSLDERGFINYFGLQRFGTSNIKTCDVGLALIRQSWGEVVEKILMPRPNEKFSLMITRQFWWQYRDARGALKYLGRNNNNLVEARLLLGLTKCDKTNLVGALNFVQKGIRLMYLHSYQSYVFNRVVSKRIAQHGLDVLVGDLFLPTDELDRVLASVEVEPTPDTPAAAKDKDKERRHPLPDVLQVTEENVDSVSIYSVVMPLPGFMVKYPDNEVKSMYEDVLKEDGLSFGSFKNPVREYSLGGGYRPMLGKVADLQWRFVHYTDPSSNLVLSDLERVKGVTALPNVIESGGDAVGCGTYKGVVVDFSLKSSQYATMALREALKVDTGRTAQTALTGSHAAEFGAKEEAAKAMTEGKEEEEDEGVVAKRPKLEDSG